MWQCDINVMNCPKRHREGEEKRAKMSLKKKDRGTESDSKKNSRFSHLFLLFVSNVWNPFAGGNHTQAIHNVEKIKIIKTSANNFFSSLFFFCVAVAQSAISKWNWIITNNTKWQQQQQRQQQQKNKEKH